MEGFDLRGGAGRLGLQGAPGTLPSALGVRIRVLQMQKPHPKGGTFTFGGDGGIRTPVQLPAN